MGLITDYAFWRNQTSGPSRQATVQDRAARNFYQQVWINQKLFSLSDQPKLLVLWTIVLGKSQLSLISC